MSLGAKIKRTFFDTLLIAYLMFAVVLPWVPEMGEHAEGMRQAVLVFLALSVVALVISLVLSAGGKLTLGHMLFAPIHMKQGSGVPPAWYRTAWGLQAVLATSVTFVLGLTVAQIDVLAMLEKEAFTHAMRLFAELVNPDWSVLPRAIVKIIESVFIAFMATIIAVPAAFVLSFLCARNVMAKSNAGLAVYTVLRMIFNIARSVEPVLWAIIFSIWVGFGPFAGMLALMIHSVASLAKQYAEQIECVEEGPIEGIQSTGASYLQTIWFAIVPQVVLPFISFTIFRWDINVRMATIIGFVGGGGIGTMLLEYQGQARWPQVGCIIFVIAFVVWVMDTFSAYVREAVK